MGKKDSCFENTAKVITGLSSINNLELNDEWVLAHGIVTATGGKYLGQQYSHAWIESEHLVYDTEMEKLLLKKNYYKMRKIEQVTRYTKQKAAGIMCKEMHFGPWEQYFYSDRLAG